MSYQVLARKWRPQDFASLIGQEPIVTALTNALSEKRIAQAYLFSGIRGVGKTTAARLLAKSLNCVQGPTATPCNECTPCREITAGSDLDVIEVDAATYSKVEQVRELTESLRYGPARNRYKVVVLDEIHRLSRQAFDALLKIVEEPPPHLVFVFATTEAEAVPATVLSRCQEFHFRRVASATLAAHLRDISTAEEIRVSDPALRLIARAGEGSVRDSVALLDQLATFGAGVIADEDAARLVGGLDGRLLQELLTAVLEGRSGVVSETARRLEDEGWDPRQAFTQLLTFTRDALRLALAGRGDDGGSPPRVDLPEEDAAALTELARGAGYENLLRLMQHLLASEAMVRRSDNGYLAVEIAWLRAAELPKLVRVEKLLGGGPLPPVGGEGDGSARGGAAPASRGSGPGAPTAAADEPRAETQPLDASRADRNDGGAAAERRPPSLPSAPPRPEPAATPAPQPEGSGRPRPPAARPTPESTHPDQHMAAVARAAVPRAAVADPAAAEGGAPPPVERSGHGNGAPSTGPNGSTPSDVRSSSHPSGNPRSGEKLPRSREAFLEEILRRKQPLAAHLEAAELVFRDGALRIRHEPGDDWLPTRLSREDNRKVVDEAVHSTWGPQAGWRLEEGEARPRDEGADRPAAPDPEMAQAAEHPTVQAVLDLFNGQIDGVDSIDAGTEPVDEREER